MHLSQAEKELSMIRFQTELLSERVRLRLSVAQAAKTLEISTPTYNLYERGRPKLREWERLGMITHLQSMPTPGK